MSLEEDIRNLIRNEVDRQMEGQFDRVEDAIQVLEKMRRDLEDTRSALYRSMQDIKSINEMLAKRETPPLPVETKRVAPRMPESRPAPAPRPEPEPEPTEEYGAEEPEELQWVKEQDGNLDKGETQIWRYGEHSLTVWTEGKKTFAQVDDDAAQELWKQSDLEKIQKRIEKME